MRVHPARGAARSWRSVGVIAGGIEEFVGSLLSEWVDDSGNRPAAANAVRYGYARLTKDLVEFVAEIVSRQDRISVYTFLDEGFDVDWGQIQRKIRGKAVSKDLTLEENSQPGMPAIAIGAGRYRVQIGSRVFPCYRVIDAASGECGEAFLDKHGRTICCRMYSVKGEGEASIQVNGTKYRHQYNWFTNLAFE